MRPFELVIMAPEAYTTVFDVLASALEDLEELVEQLDSPADAAVRMREARRAKLLKPVVDAMSRRIAGLAVTDEEKQS